MIINIYSDHKIQSRASVWIKESSASKHINQRNERKIGLKIL